MKEAAQGGLAEVELGNLAAQKASSGEVKSFGQQMVQDHTKANDQLKQLASSKGVNLPSQPSHMQMAEKKRLEKLSGTQFDQAYMSDMLKDPEGRCGFPEGKSVGQGFRFEEFCFADSAHTAGTSEAGTKRRAHDKPEFHAKTESCNCTPLEFRTQQQ